MHVARLPPRAHAAGASAGTGWVVRTKLLATLVIAIVAAAPGAARAADGPGAVLRRYLDARWKGDVAAAEALWDAVDLRRSQALGTRYPGLEARYDDNLLWTVETRAAAASSRPAIVDSTVEASIGTFTVVVRGAAGADTLRYGVRSTAGEWRVAAPYEAATRAWTAREARFVRLRAARLRDVNSDAIAALDAGVDRTLQRLGAPEQTRLRLERVKIEYYLCHDAADVRALCGSTPPGYRLAGERVVSRSNSDLNAIGRALVHVVAKELPPRAVPLLEDGTAAALGGWRDWSGPVTAQRGAALAARRDAAFETVLDATRFASLPGEIAVPLAAAWSEALLRALGPERFLALYAELSTGTAPGRAFDAAGVRARIETAASKRGAALVDWVRAEAARVEVTLHAAGSRSIPEETRTMQPFMRWRDMAERWSLEAYEIGDEYTFVVRPYAGPTPKWAQKLMDSVTVVQGKEVQPRPVLQRPPGDPPQLAISIRRRVYNEPEAYESRLYKEHFPRRHYAGELWGLFIGLDSVRLWDYRRDGLVAAVAPEFAVAGDPPLYDQPAGVICFRLRRDVFSEPLVLYVAACAPYTGE